MNASLEGLEGIPDAQKQLLLQKIEEMQVKDRCLMGWSLGKQRQLAAIFMPSPGASCISKRSTLLDAA